MRITKSLIKDLEATRKIEETLLDGYYFELDPDQRVSLFDKNWQFVKSFDLPVVASDVTEFLNYIWQINAHLEETDLDYYGHELSDLSKRLIYLSEKSLPWSRVEIKICQSWINLESDKIHSINGVECDLKDAISKLAEVVEGEFNFRKIEEVSVKQEDTLCAGD